jgi:hypothetical protein
MKSLPPVLRQNQSKTGLQFAACFDLGQGWRFAPSPMMVMPTVMIVAMIAVMIAVMMVPVYFGRHLPRSELLIILDRASGAGIDQGRRTGLLGGRGKNQQRGRCGKAQNSRHGHYDFLLQRVGRPY